MYPKTFLPVLLLSTFASVVACSGSAQQNSDEMTEADQMDNAEAATQTAAETFSLGSGMATVVHPGSGGSPHVKVDWIENGANISISYGRPYLKDRVVGEDVRLSGQNAPLPDCAAVVGDRHGSFVDVSDKQRMTGAHTSGVECDRVTVLDLVVERNADLEKQFAAYHFK